MEGKEVESVELLEMLPDILADYLAGDCECRVEIHFVVTPPGCVEEVGSVAHACAAVADGGAGEEVGTDGPAD